MCVCVFVWSLEINYFIINYEKNLYFYLSFFLVKAGEEGKRVAIYLCVCMYACITIVQQPTEIEYNRCNAAGNRE